MNNLKLSFFICLILVSCVSKKKTKAQSPINKYQIISTDGVDIEVKDCIKTYNDYKQSENEIDIFFYKFQDKKERVVAKRIMKKNLNSKVMMFDIINDTMIEIPLADSIIDLFPK